MEISGINKTNIDYMLQKFSFTCNTFTTTMTIKHELQHSVINGQYNISDSTKVGDFLNDAVTILSCLQTLADNLQRVKVKLMQRHHI